MTLSICCFIDSQNNFLRGVRDYNFEGGSGIIILRGVRQYNFEGSQGL